MSYEPQLDDDVALGMDTECEDCGARECCCECNEPDEMYGELFGYDD